MCYRNSIAFCFALQRYGEKLENEKRKLKKDSYTSVLLIYVNVLYLFVDF